MKCNTFHNIVLVNQSSGHLVADIANAALNHFDKVVVMAHGCNTAERPLDKRVKIDKLVKYNKQSALKRILSWTIATMQILWKLAFKYRNYHVLYFSNPPTSYFCSLFLKNKYSIMVYDLYPNALATIGIKKDSFIYRRWSEINRKLFAKAQVIYTLSEGMRQQMKDYCSLDIVRPIPLWSGFEQMKPVPKSENPFVEEHGLRDKFVVLYSGNIGYTHSVEVLVDVAKQMQTEQDVVFLIIGDGKKKAEIVHEVNELKLQNVMFLPFQPVDTLPYSLSSADLGVVTLDENVANVSVPSKTFNLMAVGAPILSISNNETELYRLLSKYGNGRCIPKDSIQEMVDFIMELKRNKEYASELRMKSLNASSCFTYKNAELLFSKS